MSGPFHRRLGSAQPLAGVAACVDASPVVFVIERAMLQQRRVREVEPQHDHATQVFRAEISVMKFSVLEAYGVGDLRWALRSW